MLLERSIPSFLKVPSSLRPPAVSHKISYFAWLRNPRPCRPTHILGGNLDVFASHGSSSVRGLNIMPIDCSGHHLLWSSPFKNPTPVYKTIITRKWLRLDILLLLNIIESSFSVDVDNVDVDVSTSRLYDAIL